MNNITLDNNTFYNNGTTNPDPRFNSLYASSSIGFFVSGAVSNCTSCSNQNNTTYWHTASADFES